MTEKPAEYKHESSEEKKPKRKAASFRIPKKAVEILIANKATAFQIGTYLTLARYTDASGKYSTAGFNAVRNALGVSGGTKGEAARLVDQLKGMKLVRKPKKGDPETPVDEEGREITRAKVRAVLDDFGDDKWIWFGAGLVDGYGRFRQPLRRLKQCGDVAARFLLKMYELNDMEQYGGVLPCGGVYEGYETEHHKRTHGFDLWIAWEGSSRAWLDPVVLGLDKFAGRGTKKYQKEWQPFWDALKALDAQGLIYRIVTVMDGDPDTLDARPIYELHFRSQHGLHPPKGEGGLAGRLAPILETLANQATADSQGRFRGTYPVISPVGITPHVTGVYRLRFRVSNPKNYTVSEAWQRIHRDQGEVEGWIKRLEKVASKKKESDIGQEDNADQQDTE